MKTTKFKPSEVGPIPEEWEVKRLRDVCDKIRNGYGYDFREHGTYPMSRIETISSGEINYSRVALIEDEPPPEYRLRPGDILYSHINSLPYIGNIAQYDGSGCLYHGMNLLLVRPANTVDSVYLKYILKSEPMRNLARSAAKLAINQASISTKELAQFQIVLPPRPEQKKIAEALSDVDALLAAMTKLIEKKRAVKQGAMQQLLTGQKRLAGFTGKWVEKRLGDVVEINPSLESVIPEKFVYVDLESVAGGRLLERKLVLRERAPSRAQRRFVQGDILFQTVRPYQRNNLLVGFDAANYVASTGYAVIRGRALCSCSEFIYHIIHVDDFVNGVLDRCTGTSYPAINPGKLAEIIVRIPEAVAEQRAIASVLSDMDAEIAALEAKRAKYESIKQGMMQELLTGKTRLA